ncbi:hypothetical protein, conserved [Leishmania tarentolae]|uniref:PH domain-containing protein n=1 Tax=Leishmania tarentolae TaxID=5689 RepID=A0A640KTQ1_LEITA|nr:hypothetical protein, conserved [Leishmania tarentolae]
MSDRNTPRPKGRQCRSDYATPISNRRRPYLNLSALSTETSTSRTPAPRDCSTERKADPSTRRRSSMLSALRIPVHEEPEDEAQDSPAPYTTSPFRGASPSIVSMARAGSISSENVPPPQDIQHIEGQLWYITGKNGPGKKHAPAQWVVCEDQRLSVYSSWAKSSRLVEETRFERVRILFDLLHPHRHPEVMGSGAPQTRRMTIHRNRPRTAAELRYAFQIRDPCSAKTLAGYHYFGVECVMCDPLTLRLRRSLSIFCTDDQDDYRKWIDFWEEMQVRYPMLRNRNTAAMSMDMSSVLMSECAFLPQVMNPAVRGKSEKDTDALSSTGLPSPITGDDDSLATTRVPKPTDGEHERSLWKDSTPPLRIASPGSASTGSVSGSLLGSVAAGGEEAETGGSDQWLALLVDAEQQSREGIEFMETSTRSVLGANQVLRDLFYHVVPTATFSSSVAAVCSKDENDVSDDAANRETVGDGDIRHALQTELRALCAALEMAKNQAFTPATVTEVSIPAESAAAGNQVLLEAYERELAELQAQNATLRRELHTHAATAAERVDKALSEWTLTGAIDAAVSDAENIGTGYEVADVSADRQRYLAADEALVRALVEAALARKSSTAALDSSGSASSSAQVNTWGESSSAPQAFHTTLSTDADGDVGTITAGCPLGTASDPGQLCQAHSGEMQLSVASTVPGDSTASLPSLVQQRLSTFATEHGRRLERTDLARYLSTHRSSLLYHVVDEIAAAFKGFVDAPHIATDISNPDDSVATSAQTAAPVSSWLFVLHRCLHRLGATAVVCRAGDSNPSSLASADVGGPATAATRAAEAAVAGDDASRCRLPAEASSNTRQSSSLPPLTDEEMTIVHDLHDSSRDVVAWIRDLLSEKQQYEMCMTALDSLTCRHKVFCPLKERQRELEKATARCEAVSTAACPSGAARKHSEDANPDNFLLEAAAASSVTDNDREDSEKPTAASSDGLEAQCRLKARLRHAMAAFDSTYQEAAELRRLLIAVLYGGEKVLQGVDSADVVVSWAMTNAAAAYETSRSAKEVGADDVDKLRGAAESSVVARAREDVLANTFTPAVLQACADTLIGASSIQNMVHSLQMTLGRCPETHSMPRWVEGVAHVPLLSQESVCALLQELQQRFAAEQDRCNELVGEVMLISSSLACSGSGPLMPAYSTEIAAAANASVMTNEALKAWTADAKHTNEVVSGQQRDDHETVEAKSDTCLSNLPVEMAAETAPHEAVHARLVAALSEDAKTRDLRSAALHIENSLLPNLAATIGGTQAALWWTVGVLLRHGAGAGVPSLEALLALPNVTHVDPPNVIAFSEADGSSLGVRVRLAGGAAEELLNGCEKATRERREWMQQLLQWLKDFTPAYRSGTGPEPASVLRCDASTAHETYAKLLEELAAAESEHMNIVGAVEALLWKTNCVRSISVPEMSDESGDADKAVLAAAAVADIAATLHLPEAHVSVTAASVDPVKRLVHVSATIAHHPRELTRASVLVTVHTCTFVRLQEALRHTSVDPVAIASVTGEQSTSQPATVDSSEGIDALNQLAKSLQHRAAKMASVIEFEKGVLTLLPKPQETVMAHAGMPTIDAAPACKAGQALAGMLGDTLGIRISEADTQMTSTGSEALNSLASYLEKIHDAALPALHDRNSHSGNASLEKLRTAVNELHDFALQQLTEVELELLPSLHNHIDKPWPEALEIADLRHIHLILEHLANRTNRATPTHSTADRFNDLRAIAQALNLPPDAYAGERDGECVPTTEQLAERAGAVMSARAEEAAGLRAIAQALDLLPDVCGGDWSDKVSPKCSEVVLAVDALVERSRRFSGTASLDRDEGEAAVRVLVTLWEAVEEAGVVTTDLEDGWWSVSGRSRWDIGSRLVGALSAAVEVSRENLADVSERIRLFEDKLVDVERDHNESRETITAAVEKLRGGLEEVSTDGSGEMSPPSSSGSTVCGPLFASLRQLTSEVTDVAYVLRRVKQMLEEHNAEEKCMPELEEVSFPVSRPGGCDTSEAGKVLTYEDVVAGVRAKVAALRKERARRIEIDAAMKNFLSTVTDRSTFSEDQPMPLPSSLVSRRCVKPKAKPQPADLDSSVSEEFSLPRTPLLLSTNSGNPDALLGCSGSISVPLSHCASTEALGKVHQQVNQAENVIRTMRAAVAFTYGALGGDDDVVHTSDIEAVRLLIELAQSTSESIEFLKKLLDPLEESEALTGRREQLAHLVGRIKQKLDGGSGGAMSSLFQAMDECMQSLYNGTTFSRRSRGSSVSRHLARKKKPLAPELAFTKGFHLTQQAMHHRDSSASSLSSTLRVLPPPPPSPTRSIEDFEKKIVYHMQELDSLRRGCSVALRTLDSSLNVSDMDCNAMIMNLVGCCNDVQAAMQITDAVFEDDDMISEVSAAASSYRASNPSACEHSLTMRCSVLVRAVTSLDKLCASMRNTQANMEKQQRFLIHNEAQNTGELRRALVELEEQLRSSNAERLELQKEKEGMEKKVAELSHALQSMQGEFTNLQGVRDDLETSLVQFKRQYAKDNDELHHAEEKINSFSNRATTLERVLEEAEDAVRKVLGPCQQIYLAVVGREMPMPAILAEDREQEVLLPALNAITKALQSAVEEMSWFATGDAGIAAVFAEERKHAAQQTATLKTELASVAEAKEEAEARAKAVMKHLKQTEDALEEEVTKLKRALRNSEAMMEDNEIYHQRQLRQAQAAAEDQLLSIQQRLDRAMCAQTEEMQLREASEGNVQKLRGALAEAESRLAQQQRDADEDTTQQRKGSMHHINSLEAEFAAERSHSKELALALDRAKRDSEDAVRALEAEAKEKEKLAEELADTRAQLHARNDELTTICMRIASTGLTSSIKSSAFSSTSPVGAMALLKELLDRVSTLQGALEAQETARQQRRTRGTQSEDAVTETLEAFSAIWSAAVKAGGTPALLNEAWLTPADKADVVSKALMCDDSLKLDDLAATRQTLLDLLCHSQLRYLERPAALEPLEKATTAALVQAYHETMKDCYEAQHAALERDLRDAQCRIQGLLARVQEQETKHAMEAAEVEMRVGRMREMVQSKLMADEIAEQHMRETEAAVHAHFVL